MFHQNSSLLPRWHHVKRIASQYYLYHFWNKCADRWTYFERIKIILSGITISNIIMEIMTFIRPWNCCGESSSVSELWFRHFAYDAPIHCFKMLFRQPKQCSVVYTCLCYITYGIYEEEQIWEINIYHDPQGKQKNKNYLFNAFLKNSSSVEARGIVINSTEKTLVRLSNPFLCLFDSTEWCQLY